jgi:uncharacterized protein (TIGR00369 family)
MGSGEMSEPETADLGATMRDMLRGGTGFHAFLQMDLVAHDAEAGAVTIKVPWRPEYERGADTRQWHGGPIAALIDIAGDFALVAKLGRGIPTINLRIDYLRPAVDTDLTARARTLRAGRSIGVVDIEVVDDQGRVVAVGRGSYSTA